jgi:cytochrome c oxidase assembly protein subunit 15
VRRLFAATTFLILLQLVLGATMRHQHAGLAVPDFPLAYGKLWPPMDAASVALFNQHRIELEALNPITAFQIALQMAHRIAALFIVGAVGLFAWSTRPRLGRNSLLGRMALGWLGLILLQALLGAATIWSNKAADIATAHVLVGALSLAYGTILSIVSFRVLSLPMTAATAATPVAGPFGAQSFATIGLK